MTEPTLTELREAAEEFVATFSGVDGDEFDRRIIPVLEQYLSLTDPTPLTAEHCREAGLELDRVCKAAFVDDNANESLMVWTDLSEMATKQPTLGQLRLALLRENRDGE